MTTICRDKTKYTFVLYLTSMRTKSHGPIGHPNLLLLPSSRQTSYRFSKIQRTTFIRLPVRRRMERFGWKKFLLLVFVSKFLFSLEFELNLLLFFFSPFVSLMFFSKNDMFYSTRKLSAVMLRASLVLELEKRRFKDPITTFSNLVLFFQNNSR